jgi:3-oxoacyl-[acyl-carrier protein] reductase
VSDPMAAFRLDGRGAVVTGGGSGIGRAIAETLALAGATVVVGDLDEARAAETVDIIRAAGGVATHRKADVMRREDHETLARDAAAAPDGLHIYCNVAGIPAPAVEIVDIDDDQLDRGLGPNLRGVFYGCQIAGRVLGAAGRGAILNVSSTAADIPVPGNTLYTLAKVGVVTLTKTLALELGPKGVRVNAIGPGVTVTNFSLRHFSDPDGTVNEERRAAWIETMSNMAPLRMVGTADDQALLVLYLVSDASRFVTGQFIRANGGWSMG